MDVSRVGSAASSPEPLKALAHELKNEMALFKQAVDSGNPEDIAVHVLALHKLAGEAFRC